MSRAGVFFHRIVRAVRSLLAAFRLAGRPDHRTGDRRLAAQGRPHRPNPWPRCVACHRNVAQLCEQACGVCPSCCAGHDDDEAREDDE